MSDSDSNQAGPALARYFHAQMLPGESLRAFCISRGIDYNRAVQWQSGAEPRMGHLQRVAEALGLTLLQVLVIAGFISEDEAGGAGVVPPRPSLDEAIAYDGSLSEDSKDTLRRIVAGLRAVESGEAEQAKVTKRTTRRAGRRS